MPQIFHSCRDRFAQNWGTWPRRVEANAFSDGNSCSILLEVMFCNVGKPVALAELLAAMPEDTMRTRQEPHLQTRWNISITLWRPPVPHRLLWDFSPRLKSCFSLVLLLPSRNGLVGVKLNQPTTHLLPRRGQMQPGANCSLLQRLLLTGETN